MRSAFFLNYFIVGCAILFMHGYVLASELNLDASKILAVVPVKSGNIDKAVYQKFDRIVPDLKQISKHKIIKLECRYSGRSDREQDVMNAYKLAGKIEKYLRVRHKLDLDLWIAIDMTPKVSKSSPALTIAVFSDDIKKLDAVQVDPPKNEQQ